MDEFYQSLEKMVRDMERGAEELTSIVEVDSKVYDARCYHVWRDIGEIRKIIRIDLVERSVPGGAKAKG